MLIVVSLIALLAPAAALLIWIGPVASRRNVRLRPILKRRLEMLIWAANEWTGKYRDLVLSQEPLMILGPPEDGWMIQSRPRKGFRVVFRITPEDEKIYPVSGWSREPWLKEKIDHLRETIDKLPGPRTFDEETALHDAKMAKINADMAETDKLLEELENRRMVDEGAPD